MGLGQTMLTIMFFVLLMLMFINALQTLNNADKDLLTAEITKTATDLGRSLMAEILTKKFDKGSTPGALQTTLASPPFTLPSSLGPEGAGENITLPDRLPTFKSIQKYDDVDDYDGYTRIDSANGFSGFKDSVIVYYVDATASPAKYSASMTWYKQIEVWVTQSQYLLDASNKPKWLKFSSIVTNVRKG
jgi:hypothetical protein